MDLDLLDPIPQTIEQTHPTHRDYLSYSAINTYLTCPLRYHFRYVQGLPEETIASSLVFGSALHSAVQFHFEQLLAGSDPPSLDTLLQVFQDSWQSYEGKRIQFGKREDFDHFCRLADRTLLVFQASDWAKPSGKILCVEEEFRGEILGDCPELLGRVDLIVDQGDCLELSDLKTSRSGWSESHVLDAAPQLLLYGELARELADGRPIKLSFAVMTKTQVPSFSVLPVPTDAGLLERTKKVVDQVWRSIQAEFFFPRPSPMHCPSCPYRKPCQKWSG